MDVLTASERALFESMKIPMAIYEYTDEKVVTVLVSDGFCQMKKMSREDLRQGLTDSMFNLVHPDDAGRLAKQGIAFAKKEAPYDVTYRSKAVDRSDYHLVHTLGFYQKVASGKELAFLYYCDITESGETSQTLNNIYKRLQKDTFYIDPGTGLPNSNFLHEFMGERVSEIQNRGANPAVAFIDMIGMQAYNNKYGYAGGDALLKQAAGILSEIFRGNLVTRGDVDHFVIVAPRKGLEAKLEKACLRIQTEAPEKTLGFQAGICQIEKNMGNVQAIDHAKYAVRRIREDYTRVCAVYHPEHDSEYWEQRYIVENFDNALKNNWIQIYYQGIMRIETGKMAYLEALARWNDPNLGTLSPAKFIPVLEKYHLLHKLDLYMVEQVCKEIPRREANKLKILPVSVNFSGQDFDQPDIVEKVMEILNKYGTDPKNIVVEITEQAIPKASELFHDQIKSFRRHGFKVWVDDFGSGYSSLSVFARYRFDLLKIDMELLRHLDDMHGANRKVIKAVVETAHALGNLTLAEGLETKEQFDFLKTIGCDLAQGYYYHKPESLGTIEFRNKNQGYVSLWESDEENRYYESTGTGTTV